jgi:TatD DNase family protein
MFIDTHCHLHAQEFDDEREKIIQRAIQHQVSSLITVGTDYVSSIKSLQYADQFAVVYAAVGLHPNDLKNILESDLDKVKALALHKKAVAIGEIGLDYYRHYTAKEKQHDFLRKQIQLARQLKLPVIVHNREAHQDLYTILTEEKVQEVGGVLHSFSGDEDFLKAVLKLNLYVSFTGAVTFKNTSYYKLVDRVPPEQILLETDCPYLAPVPFRGKRNEPAYIKYTAATIARIKNIAVEKLAEITTENARGLFRIDAG